MTNEEPLVVPEQTKYCRFCDNEMIKTVRYMDVDELFPVVTYTCWNPHPEGLNLPFYISIDKVAETKRECFGDPNTTIRITNEND